MAIVYNVLKPFASQASWWKEMVTRMKPYNDMLVILWILDQQDSYVCGSVHNMISRFVKSRYKQHNPMQMCQTLLRMQTQALYTNHTKFITTFMG